MITSISSVVASPLPTVRSAVPQPHDRVTLDATPPADESAALRALALRLGPPRTGWMRGSLNGSPLDLTFARQAGTVQGSASGQPVSLTTDFDASTIRGEANGGPVDLALRWSPERYSVQGTAGSGRIDMAIDWQAGTLQGNDDTDVQFSLDKGWIRGQASGQPVDLSYDAVSGNIRGTMNGAPVHATITNLGLDAFLQNLWLFAR